MARKLTIRRGLKADLPILDIGELGFSIDTKEIFIGHETGNLLLAMNSAIGDLSTLNTTSKGSVVAAINSVQLSGGSVPSNVILFEAWTGGESVTIDTTTEPDTTAPILTITPSGGTFADTQGVTMTTNETSTIYYTLDGSAPTTSSTVYTTALSVSATTTLKAFAKDTAGNSSAVQTVTFTKDATAPADTTAPIVTASPSAGTFTTSQNVTLTSNETATIYYTVDGSTPTVSSSVYNGSPIVLAATTTLKFFGKDTAGNSSAVQTVTYTKEVAADTTAPILTITPAGTFTDTKTVTMSTNETATIYYTLDDTDPTVSGTKVTYTAPLTLTATDTVKAYAKDTSGNDSVVQTVTYTKEAGTAPGTILFNDTFNRADSTTLGTTDSGHTWTGYSSANGTYTFGIRGNMAYPSGGTFLTGVNKWRRFSKKLISSDNFSIEVTTKSPTGCGAMGIGIRLLGTDDNMVYLRKSQAIGQAASQYTLAKYPSGGSITTIATGTVLAGENDVVKIEHYADGLIKVYINGVLDISATDTFGLSATNTVGMGMETDLVGHGFDDFKVTAM